MNSILKNWITGLRIFGRFMLFSILGNLFLSPIYIFVHLMRETEDISKVKIYYISAIILLCILGPYVYLWVSKLTGLLGNEIKLPIPPLKKYSPQRQKTDVESQSIPETKAK